MPTNTADLITLPVAEHGETAIALSSPPMVLEMPLVSVVIPTRYRPELLQRALCSVLSQSLREIEVIVVIDGADSDTEAALDHVVDKRLHVLSLRKSVGGSEARNIGVRYSRARWIAFLDDDDEWLSEKLMTQWKVAEGVSGAWVFVAGKFLERTESAERTLPRRLPQFGERFSDYMFSRRGWNSGEGFLQTSTWFVSRQLLTKVPFTPGLKRCQDLDWLLHATALLETHVVIVPEVLAIFHHDEHGERVSRTADWRFLYRWAETNRAYFTPRSFSFFLATFCVPSAAKQRESLGTFLFLLRRCVFGGRPSLKCLTLFAACLLISEELRRKLRASLDAVRPAPRRQASMVPQTLQGKAN